MRAPDRAAIPPMYLGRPGRYDGVAEVDKSQPPRICGTSDHGTPRARPGVLDRLPSLLPTWTYIDSPGLGPRSDNSSQFGNGAHPGRSAVAPQERTTERLSSPRPGGPSGTPCSHQGRRLRERPPDSSEEEAASDPAPRSQQNISTTRTRRTHRDGHIHPRSPLSVGPSASTVTVPPYLR